MKIIIALILILLTTNAYADKIIIPFSVYPYELQRIYAEHGKKLDLNRNDRTPDSWGFLMNEGTNFTIYTYESATDEDFRFILDMLWEHCGYGGD